jgi:Putative adhesin
MSPHEFSHDGPADAQVKVGAGDLHVVAEPTSTVTVDVRPADDSDASRQAAANTLVDFSGDRLRVEVPESGGGWLFRRGARVDIDIRLPLRSRLRANTGSADVRLDGQLGTADLNTGSGDTFIGTVTGDLTVRTGSGDIHSDRVDGDLKVKSGSGDVFVGLCVGSVSVTTGSGDIEIDEARGEVNTHTASGDIRLRTVRAGDVRANTASGDVTVGVPAGTKVWLDVNTVSGTTTSHLEMASAPPEGGAQVNLGLQTVSGAILIQRVSADPLSTED